VVQVHPGVSNRSCSNKDHSNNSNNSNSNNSNKSIGRREREREEKEESMSGTAEWCRGAGAPWVSNRFWNSDNESKSRRRKGKKRQPAAS